MRNAIQAVLAGLSGGLEGRAMQRTREDELRRLDEERLYQRQRDSAASERQALQDAVALAEKGYVEQGERAETVKRATPALQSAMFNAVSSLKGGPMVAPVNPQALQAAAGQFGPAASTVNVGGKTLERAQTPMQERTMLAAQERDQTRFDAQQERERASRDRQGDVQEKIRQLGAVYGAELDQNKLALVASGQAKLEDFIEKPLSALQRAELAIRQGQLGIDRARLKLAQDEFNRESNPTPGTTAGGDQAATLNLEPSTIQKAAEQVLAWGEKDIKKLGSWGANAASVATMESGSPFGMVTAGGLNTMLASEMDRKYVRFAGPIADAKARRSEVGVLTNQDINRYRSQVIPVAGDSEDDIRAKLAVLQSWAKEAVAVDRPSSSLFTPVPTPGRNVPDSATAAIRPGETREQFGRRTGRIQP